MKVDRKSGFSIIEFILIVAILGVAIAFGIPRYQIFRAKAAQSDVRANLTLIDKLQHGHHFSQETYSKSLKDLKFQPRGKQVYRYRIKEASNDSYIAEAIAAKGAIASCAGEDRWEINEGKKISNTKNGLASCK